MTTEERLARVEAIQEGQQKTLDRIEGVLVSIGESIAELSKAAHMGKGAGWMLIRLGAWIVAAVGVAKLVIDMVPHK